MILKQLPTHFKAKREKGVGTPFPCIAQDNPSHAGFYSTIRSIKPV